MDATYLDAQDLFMPRRAEHARETLASLLVGKSVVAAEMGEEEWENGFLTLSDGTRLRVIPNSGCGACPSGQFSLRSLSTCENVITSAEVKIEELEEDRERYTLFVLADAQELGLVVAEGENGNGMYGAGFQLQVEVV